MPSLTRIVIASLAESILKTQGLKGFEVSLGRMVYGQSL